MGQRVLVVDDDPNICAFVEAILSDAGYDVETSNTASDLIEKLGPDRPDAILLDYQLPDVDGLWALRQLRANSVLVPVIIMTATADQNTAVQFFRAGATDFIPKPFDADYLAIIVERVISHHSRNLLEKITAMSRYMAHKEYCEKRNDGPCTCGMQGVATDALETAMTSMKG